MVKPTSTGKISERSDSLYKGVRKRKWGKWVSEIRLPNSRERLWLGSYETAEKAARAFDAAVYCLRGRNAKFNFPENPPEIAGAGSLSRQEIRAAAARFANEKPGKDGSENLPSESALEYPSSSSISDGLVPAESDLSMDWTFLDSMFMGSEEGVVDPGSYSGFEEYCPEDFPAVPIFDYGEENGGGVYSQQSFLWNF